jgi:hypothetical protein
MRLITGGSRRNAMMRMESLRDPAKATRSAAPRADTSSKPICRWASCNTRSVAPVVSLAKGLI